MGVNADGRRELLGLKVGDRESEPFWSDFIGSLKERGLTGVKLVISDAYNDLTNAIRRMLQGSCWQRCRVHFARNLLQRPTRAWSPPHCARCSPRRKPEIEAREDVLAFRHFPDQHWRKVWSTNLFERVNEEIKRRTRVVDIFPNDAAITRLVGAVLLEQAKHWQLEGRKMFSAESMSAIPSLEELPVQPSLQGAGLIQSLSQCLLPGLSAWV